MNPVEWHQFLTNIIREGAGALAAVVIAALAGAVVCRWWMHREHKKRVQELQLKNEHQSETNNEVMRKLSLTLQELGISREQLNNSRDEARRHADEAARLTQEVARMRKVLKGSAATTGKAEERRGDDEASATLARLEAENKELAQGKQALEKAVEKLQTELAQVRGELAHSARWLKVFDEEIARLTQDESVGAQ
jgi:hypothetical protein